MAHNPKRLRWLTVGTSCVLMVGLGETMVEWTPHGNIVRRPGYGHGGEWLAFKKGTVQGEWFVTLEAAKEYIERNTLLSLGSSSSLSSPLSGEDEHVPDEGYTVMWVESGGIHNQFYLNKDAAEAEVNSLHAAAHAVQVMRGKPIWLSVVRTGYKIND